MKKKLLKNVLFILLVSLNGLLTAQTSQLPSGFFGFEETDPTGWFISAESSPYLSISDGQAATGVSSLKFNFPDYSALSDGAISILADAVPGAGAKVDLTSGTYTMKVKVYVEANAPALFKTIFKPGWIQVDWDISGIETGKWVELTKTVTLPDFTDGGMVIQVYQTAFTVMTGSGSFYVDDIEIYAPDDPIDLDDPETPIDEHYFSFELGGGSWYTPSGQVQFVEINNSSAASGLYSIQYSFADYSTVYNSVDVWTQSKPDWKLDFEMGKFYEIKVKVLMEDVPDAVFPSGFDTYVKGDGGKGYQAISWVLDDISQRGEWVEKTQIFQYSGEGVSPGEIVSRQMVIQIGKTKFPQTGSGTIRIDDISILEVAAPPTYPLVLGVDPSEITADANAHGAGDYIEDANVSISVSVVAGYDFTGWTGSVEDLALLADAGSRETSFTMPARNVSFTATYTQQTTYPLDLSVDPSGITADANAQGAGNYIEDASVQISVSAVAGYDFTGWTGSVEDVALLADASSRETSFTMPGRSISLTATFTEINTHFAGRELPAIRLYPVPAVDIITVEATEMIKQIRIMDMSGKILSDQMVQNQVEQLNVNNLSPGHYFIQVITSDQSMVMPVQIIR